MLPGTPQVVCQQQERQRKNGSERARGVLERQFLQNPREPAEAPAAVFAPERHAVKGRHRLEGRVGRGRSFGKAPHYERSFAGVDFIGAQKIFGLEIFCLYPGAFPAFVKGAAVEGERRKAAAGKKPFARSARGEDLREYGGERAVDGGGQARGVFAEVLG